MPKLTKSINSNPDGQTALDRREALKLFGFGAVAATAGSLLSTETAATPASAKALLNKLSGSTNYGSGKVSIKLPEIAENGAVVPITVSVDSPMTKASYVKAIHIAAELNPRPEVASFHLSPASGKAEVSTRMRMAKTMNVVAVAVMNDGSVQRAVRKVKVTIGGCGG